MFDIFVLKESIRIQLYGWPIYMLLMFCINANVYPERTLAEQMLTLGLTILVFNLCSSLCYMILSRRLMWIGLLCLLAVYVICSQIVFHSTYRILPKYDLILYDDPLAKLDGEFYWRIFNKYITVMILSTALVLHIRAKRNLLAKQREMQLRFEKELESKESQLALLNAQINPHFVFNILTSMQDACLEQLPKVAMGIERLSGLIRYIVDSRDALSLNVIIEKEIDAIERYLELESLRFGETAIHYTVEGTACGQKVPPGILLTLVENAFKYTFRNDPQKPIKIHILLEDDRLEFSCSNHINQARTNLEPSGIGLRNTAYRVQMLYPGKHELLIDSSLPGIFKVTLKIDYS